MLQQVDYMKNTYIAGLLLFYINFNLVSLTLLRNTSMIFISQNKLCRLFMNYTLAPNLNHISHLMKHISLL